MTNEPGTEPAGRVTESRVDGFWPYRGSVIAMGTQHGKGDLLAPAFRSFLGARIVTPSVDTDQYGTFTGDIPRTLAPTDAARVKAHAATSAAQTPFGMASEGSYAALASLGVPAHEEILLFVDHTRGIEVIETHRQLTNAPSSQTISTIAEAHFFLMHCQKEGIAVIVRPADGDWQTHITKGITTESALTLAVSRAIEASPNRQLICQPDLRAHMNPPRQAVLTDLGQRLARRLATPCPNCTTPGYGRTSIRIGLPCAACQWPTDLVTADVISCAHCDHREILPRQTGDADPRHCDMCNP